MRATSSAGMVSSSWSRQANTTNVAKAPIAPAATIHQMCHISAKPIMVAKNAQTKPVAELRGISILRLFVRAVLSRRTVLERPIGILTGYLRQHREIEGRRGRRGGPFER